MKIAPDVHPEQRGKERGWYGGVRLSASWEEAMRALRAALHALRGIFHHHANADTEPADPKQP